MPTHLSRPAMLFAALLWAAVPFCAAQSDGATPARGGVTVVDLTPKFLAFYDSATKINADADQRFALWQRMDGFAAIPPGPFGQHLARQLLDSAWSRYPAALPRIREGVAALGTSPDSILESVVNLLHCGQNVRVRLTVFVGGFEGNAFAFGVSDGMSNVAVPVEGGKTAPEMAMAMAHEFTHAVHRTGCAPSYSGYESSLAELVVAEGLAMRATEELMPGHDAAFYTSAAPGWLAACLANRAPILRGVREHLVDKGTEVVQRFTFGKGTTGESREAYCAGWMIVGAMTQSFGMTFHDIAVTPGDELPGLVRRAIDRILASGGT